jgi:hypothetical protein
MTARAPFLKRLDRARTQLLVAAKGLGELHKKDFDDLRAKLERSALRFAAAALDARLRELDPSDKDPK